MEMFVSEWEKALRLPAGALKKKFAAEVGQ